MDKVNVKSACLIKTLQNGDSTQNMLHQPLDIGLSSVIKNWACFIILHLKHPHADGMALLRGTHAFTLELKGMKW